MDYQNLLSDTLPVDVDFKNVVANTDKVLSDKYPQLSKLIKYPNRSKQLKLYEKVHEKVLRKAQQKNEEPLYKDEKDNARQFYDESAKIGKENMKTFLLLNQQRTHNIPDDVRKSLIAFKMYYDIPIIDGILMSPYNNNANWKNGKLMSLNTKKLRDYMKTRINLGNEKELVKYPEYRLLRAYVRGPGQYRKIKSILAKEEQAYANPNKMASRIVSAFKKNGYYNDLRPTPSKYVSGADLKNLTYLQQTLTNDRLNAQKDRSEKIKPMIDKLITSGDIRSEKMTDYYKKFAPPYAKLLNKNL